MKQFSTEREWMEFVKSVEKPDDNGVRCRCCDQGKVKRFHCPACNDLDRPADRESAV